MLISDNIDFKTRNIRDKEKYFIIIKLSIHQKNTTNNRASKFIKKKVTELNGEMQNLITRVRDFNILLSVIY